MDKMREAYDAWAAKYKPQTDFATWQAAWKACEAARATPAQPVPCFEEQWSKGDDIVCTDSLPIAGINVQSKHGHIHGNAIEFFAEKLEVAQARRDKVLSLLSEAAALAEQVQGQQWISVLDRLPETFVYDDTPCKLDGKEIPPAIHSLRVIVALNDGMVREDRLEGLQGNPPYWLAFRERVSAWMPMPAAPSIAQDGQKSEGT